MFETAIHGVVVGDSVNILVLLFVFVIYFMIDLWLFVLFYKVPGSSRDILRLSASCVVMLISVLYRYAYQRLGLYSLVHCHAIVLCATSHCRVIVLCATSSRCVPPHFSVCHVTLRVWKLKDDDDVTVLHYCGMWCLRVNERQSESNVKWFRVSFLVRLCDSR